MPKGVKGSGKAAEGKKAGKGGTIIATGLKQSFEDAEGYRLRLAGRRGLGTKFEVFAFHEDKDKKNKRSGVLSSWDTEGAMDLALKAAWRDAQTKGWSIALNRRGGGGLKDIPEPKLSPATRGLARRTA